MKTINRLATVGLMSLLSPWALAAPKQGTVAKSLTGDEIAALKAAAKDAGEKQLQALLKSAQDKQFIDDLRLVIQHDKQEGVDKLISAWLVTDPKMTAAGLKTVVDQATAGFLEKRLHSHLARYILTHDKNSQKFMEEAKRAALGTSDAQNAFVQDKQKELIQQIQSFLSAPSPDIQQPKKWPANLYSLLQPMEQAYVDFLLLDDKSDDPRVIRIKNDFSDRIVKGTIDQSDLPKARYLISETRRQIDRGLQNYATMLRSSGPNAMAQLQDAHKNFSQINGDLENLVVANTTYDGARTPGNRGTVNATGGSGSGTAGGTAPSGPGLPIKDPGMPAGGKDTADQASSSSFDFSNAQKIMLGAAFGALAFGVLGLMMVGPAGLLAGTVFGSLFMGGVTFLNNKPAPKPAPSGNS